MDITQLIENLNRLDTNALKNTIIIAKVWKI